jgi:hypothetical protein
MATMYASVPLDDAMTRIRKIGYGYISMSARHGSDVVFSPELTKAQRSAMLRRIRDLGIQPFMSLGGFRGELQKEDGLPKYIAQLDLCADYEIPVMVGGGPCITKSSPTLRNGNATGRKR